MLNVVLKQEENLVQRRKFSANNEESYDVYLYMGAGLHSQPSGNSTSPFMLACVASVSVWFRGKEIPRKETFGFDRARNETRAHPLPALLLAPLFSRSLTLVPRFFLLNRTETLATQATFM